MMDFLYLFVCQLQNVIFKKLFKLSETMISKTKKMMVILLYKLLGPAEAFPNLYVIVLCIYPHSHIAPPSLPMVSPAFPLLISSKSPSIFIPHIFYYSCFSFFITKDLSHDPYQFCAFPWFKHTHESTFKRIVLSASGLSCFSQCVHFFLKIPQSHLFLHWVNFHCV